MEHGLDERHAKIFFSRPRPPQIRTQQTHFFSPLRLHRKFPSPFLPRRSRPRQKLAAPQNARRPVAAIRKPPSSLRLSVRSPPKTTPLYAPVSLPPPRIDQTPHP